MCEKTTKLPRVLWSSGGIAHQIPPEQITATQVQTPLHFLRGPHVRVGSSLFTGRVQESNMSLLVERSTELPHFKAHTCRLLSKSDDDRICVVPVLTTTSKVRFVLPVLMDKSQA